MCQPESNYSTVWMLSDWDPDLCAVWWDVWASAFSLGIFHGFTYKYQFISNPHTLSHFTVMTPWEMTQPSEQMKNGKWGGDDCNVSGARRLTRSLFWVESGGTFYPLTIISKGLDSHSVAAKGESQEGLHTTPRSGRWTMVQRTLPEKYRAKETKDKIAVDADLVNSSNCTKYKMIPAGFRLAQN